MRLLVGRLWVLLASLPVAPVLLLFPLLGRLSLMVQVAMLVIPLFTLQGVWRSPAPTLQAW